MKLRLHRQFHCIKNKVRYQFIRFSASKKAINVPDTKNGPKGISEEKDFFLFNIKKTPTIDPKRKAKNKATKTLGQPKNKPIKKANFTSPTPIHFPLETNAINRKNPKEDKSA